MELVTEIYKLVDKFPKTETYGLSSQMKRAAVSVPSNIAEGRRRSTHKDFRNFLLTAYGSGSELETQIEIAKRLDFCDKKDFQSSERLLREVMRMLNRLAYNLQPNS